jgi:hypothetical protein
MQIKNAIIVVTAFVFVFASIAVMGSISQKIQDAGVSRIDPDFVPSTGQINNGTGKLPS